MIRFTVVWRTEAENDLANIWMLRPHDRELIGVAQQTIDRELKLDGHEKGAFVSEDLRRIDVHPLRAYYEVHLDDRQIMVSQLFFKSSPTPAD